MTKLGANAVVAGLVGGAVGGLLGAVLAEVLYSPSEREFTSEAGLRTQSGIWVAIVAAVLGFVLRGWDGFTSGSPQKAVRDGGIGALVGAVAGFIGGYVAQMIYASMLDDISFDDDIETTLITARVMAWAIFGGLLGGGLGLGATSKKVVNGLIGGTIGGAVGGLMFQLIDNSNDDGGSGTMNRFIGLTLTGVGIGAGIGAVERARRESWITITAGPMSGKEFILYNMRTIIGADYHCNIVLVRDPAVAAQHLAFDRTPQGTAVTSLGGTAIVNGMSVASHRLKHGDQIAVGASVLSYQERALSGPQM